MYVEGEAQRIPEGLRLMQMIDFEPLACPTPKSVRLLRGTLHNPADCGGWNLQLAIEMIYVHPMMIGIPDVILSTLPESPQNASLEIVYCSCIPLDQSSVSGTLFLQFVPITVSNTSASPICCGPRMTCAMRNKTNVIMAVSAHHVSTAR